MSPEQVDTDLLFRGGCNIVEAFNWLCDPGDTFFASLAHGRFSHGKLTSETGMDQRVRVY